MALNKKQKHQWDAKDVTFLYICCKLGVKLESMADHFGVTKQAIHEACKRNYMRQGDLRFTAAQVKELWEAGALRFLF